MANPGDGTTASGTTVATGTGGTALDTSAIDDQVDVLFMAESATSRTATIADSQGSFYPAPFDHQDFTASHGREFYRWRAHIVRAASLIVTVTYGAAAPLSLAVALVKNVIPGTPMTAGQFASHYQSAASIGPTPATDLQSSTNTPALALQPTILSVWGYCDGQNAAPVAGTAFTQVGVPVWAALGAACLTYEQEIYNSLLAVSGRFTPVPSEDAYTFLTVFNQNPPPPFAANGLFVIP